MKAWIKHLYIEEGRLFIIDQRLLPDEERVVELPDEKAVYDAVQDYGITEHVVYMNGETGYKISEYYEGARNSDPRDWDDVARCMALVEKLHDSKLHVDHSFDIRERISFYEALCRGYEKKLFEDYPEVSPRDSPELNALAALPQLPRSTRIFFDYGTLGRDECYGPYHARLAEILHAKGWTNQYTIRRIEGGFHSELSWRQRLGDALKFLFLPSK